LTAARTDLPRFEPLGPQHDRAAFSCGVPELDIYIRTLASQHSRRKISTTTVLLVDDAVQIAGYHTLSSARLELGQLPPALAKRYPRYAEGIPATLLGRLAVDSRYAGKGWGEALLLNALERSFLATRAVASAFVIVRAIDADASRFYQRYGFKELPTSPGRLFLTMKTVESVIAG
jgi:ribosomal protein S18 acetylase RimI-like enzyme